eukprot:COSAG01_NODE_293_length_19376_cov_41.772060_16_plen_112_part_00
MHGASIGGGGRLAPALDGGDDGTQLLGLGGYGAGGSLYTDTADVLLCSDHSPVHASFTLQAVNQSHHTATTVQAADAVAARPCQYHLRVILIMIGALDRLRLTYVLRCRHR